MSPPRPAVPPTRPPAGPSPAALPAHGRGADKDRYPLLLADIGGTNVRLAIKVGPDAPAARHSNFATAAFRSIADVVAAWLADRDETGPGLPDGRIAQAVLAVAAPLRNGPIRLTNTDFTVDGAELARRLASCQVHLMNDFEAQAWSLPTLRAGDYRPLGPQTPTGQQTMVVLGPGTGLGCASLVRLANGGWLPLPGEGGHATLSAQTELEAEVIAVARRSFDHVSAERLVSGSGLPLLYRCLASVQGETPDPALDSGERISEAAAGAPLAAATIDLFGALLGGFAGNVALVAGARGGVWIAGGIAPHLFDRLAASPFRARFEQKGRFANYLGQIGTAVVTRRDPAIEGLAFAFESGGLGQQARAGGQAGGFSEPDSR